jgi:hypothetical protein
LPVGATCSSARPHGTRRRVHGRYVQRARRPRWRPSWRRSRSCLGRNVSQPLRARRLPAARARRDRRARGAGRDKAAGYGSVWLRTSSPGLTPAYEDLLRNDDALDAALPQGARSRSVTSSSRSR